MSGIIHPQTGKPTSSERKTYLEVRLIDRQPGAGDATQHRVLYEIDKPDRASVQQLVAQIGRSVLSRLEQIGFFDPAPSGLLDVNGVPTPTKTD